MSTYVNNRTRARTAQRMLGFVRFYEPTTHSRAYCAEIRQCFLLLAALVVKLSDLFTSPAQPERDVTKRLATAKQTRTVEKSEQLGVILGRKPWGPSRRRFQKSKRSKPAFSGGIPCRPVPNSHLASPR